MHSLARTNSLVFFFLLLVSSGPLAAATPLVHHQIDAVVTPGNGEISVTDTMTFTAKSGKGAVAFHLYPGLKITAVKGGQLTTLAAGDYTLQLPPTKRELTLHYEGKIRDALVDISDSAGKTQHTTRGWIGPDGVFLSGSAPWYPLIDNAQVNFDLVITLPKGWSSISQGISPPDAPNHWHETHPQEDIYLLAGDYKRYDSSQDAITAQVYLHQPDKALAQRYLAATHRYLKLYDALIGRYPYRKFALVENFWETGYGMPSFTLLGPTVIRLPFIIHTSYPHEILHNWFGNGVFVDYARGNWSEGLTTYLADHLLREKRGNAADYRRSTLQRYANHATAENDFPLSRFIARHGDSSQAIGYGKAMMFFHMLRIRLGDKAFFQGLRDFYAQQLFKQASYRDLQATWEKASGQSLTHFFDQWLNRTGAPRLAVTNATVSKQQNHYRFSATLEQQQGDAPFPLTVPVKASFAKGHQPVVTRIKMHGRSQSFTLQLPAKPRQVAIDPDFDVFRQLYPEENPATLSTIFGSQEVTIILPSDASPALLTSYQHLARQWSAKRKSNWKVLTDQRLQALPERENTILLGWENHLTASFVEQHPDRLAMRRDQLEILQQTVDTARDSVALALKRKNGATTLFIASTKPAAISGLARKLPHYGKYGFLIFSGNQPTIRKKQQWEILDSPLIFSYRE